MTDHDHDNLIDKAKDALGGEDEERVTHTGDEPTGGWAGVDDALGGVGDRPAGAIYSTGDVEDDDYNTTRREHQP